MTNEGKCKLCRHACLKKKLFGGQKLICNIQKREVGNTDSCSNYVRDGNKVLQFAGFKKRVCGSSDGCDTCSFRESSNTQTKTIYRCKKHRINFWDNFSPLDYVCDSFENGGEDALLDFMVDILMEEDRMKKGKS